MFLIQCVLNLISHDDSLLLSYPDLLLTYCIPEKIYELLWDTN